MFAEGGIPSETVAHVAELIEPIKDRVIGMLEGNHETAIRKYMDRSIASEIAKELGISGKLLGYQGFVQWAFKRRSVGPKTSSSACVIIHAHHGYQGGRRSGALINESQLEKSRYPSADIIMRGHAHQRLGNVFDAVVPGRYHVRDAPWAYVCTGTYKLGRVDTTINEAHHDTWEATKGFHPKSRGRLGPPVITVTPATLNGQNPTAAPFGITVTT